MSKKVGICSEIIKTALASIPTPFYLYDEAAIRSNARDFLSAFAWAPGFTEFFAVKANPNPYLLKILASEGLGADCSSLPELILAQRAGIQGEQIVFTSNNTPIDEYSAAIDAGALINFDDVTHVDYVLKNLGKLPDFVSFRYNPGDARAGGNAIIGKPSEAKYGCTREQIFTAINKCREHGVKRFGLHTMIASNEMNMDWFTETARMMFGLALAVQDNCGVRVELVNFGGGVGIPYLPEQTKLDLNRLGAEIEAIYNTMVRNSRLHPLNLAMECGRVILGPYGYLLTKAIHQKATYKNYLGVDTCMAALMRPGLYGAYHHISVFGKEQLPLTNTYDVVGSLCENNDKFAIDRLLPAVAVGDCLILHDAGAHGHSMGFNYNGKLRPAEYLVQEDGTIRQIRRAETIEDYFATLDFNNL
ncbi:MAG: diaminopimelate decarboxylase [Bacillota bacterium]